MTPLSDSMLKRLPECDLMIFLVEYETTSTWWAALACLPWLRGVVADHFIRKAKRKLRAYRRFAEMRERVQSRRLAEARQ